MTLIYRKAKIQDLQQILNMAIAEADVQHPKLRADIHKIRQLVIECISSPTHYAMVAEDEGGYVQAAVLALVHDALWAERKIANLILWVSRVRSAGAHLMRRLRTWVSGRRGIRMIGVSPMVDWDERISTLLVKLGFERQGGSFIYYN